MPASEAARKPQPHPRKRPPDALERFYAYWIISVVVIVLALAVITTIMWVTLCRHAETTNESLTALGERVSSLENAVAELRGQRAMPPPTVPTQADTAAAGRPADKPVAEPADRPGASSERVTPSPKEETNPAPAAAPDESKIVAGLDRAMTEGLVLPEILADETAAARVLELALEHAAGASWSASTWARLAVLARLMLQDPAADRFAERAYQAGDPLTVFSEVSARLFLAQGRPQEALVHADHYAEQTDGSATARLLLAHVFLSLGQPAAADELLVPVTEPEALSDVDKLALARACLYLHNWDRLAAAMAAVKTVPEALEDERSFLQAVVQIQQSKDLVVALSVLDYLAEREEAASPVADCVPRPDEYEIATWRGVALTRGQQTAAAREAFDAAAALAPGRPEAYYWRALLEHREGQFEAAMMFLQNALATSAQFAPAWEALGQMALNADELDSALDSLQRAVAANPRRASAHFSIAVAHAKASRREAAAAALRAAFALDPRYVESAQQTPALTRLFSPEELKDLAAAPEEPAPEADADDTEQ